jgi:hypothetical protein
VACLQVDCGGCELERGVWPHVCRHERAEKTACGHGIMDLESIKAPERIPGLGRALGLGRASDGPFVDTLSSRRVRRKAIGRTPINSIVNVKNQCPPAASPSNALRPHSGRSGQEAEVVRGALCIGPISLLTVALWGRGTLRQQPPLSSSSYRGWLVDVACSVA